MRKWKQRERKEGEVPPSWERKLGRRLTDGDVDWVGRFLCGAEGGAPDCAALADQCHVAPGAGALLLEQRLRLLGPNPGVLGWA